jgi:NAD(P)-dependent dehydrogenase (short-subunit alcohol dehydrogenase family)
MLEGKTAIITGAASGIGRSMARAFAGHGAKITLVDLNEAKLAKVVAQLTEQGAGVTSLCCDIAEVDRIVDHTLETFGGVHAVCNNAGVLDELRPVAETDDAMWDKVMGVNLTAPFKMCRRLVPIFKEQGGGSIVNTTSAAGMRGGRAGVAYTASKHGIIGLTRSIAWYYGADKIRCNAIAPGSIQTSMQMSMVPHPDAFEKILPYLPLIPEPGKAMEVAQVAAFLCSDAASYVNGAVIPVDGGWLAY